MQAGDKATAKRDDVVDFVGDSCGFRTESGQVIGLYPRQFI